MTCDIGRSEPAAASLLGLKDIGVLLVMQFIWGGGLVITKVAINDMPPLLFMTLRFLIVSMLLVPFLRWHRGQMVQVALIALFMGAAHFGLMVTGLSMADDVSPVAILSQLTVPFATLLSVIFLHERLGIWRSSALVLAFGGVMVVGFDPVVFQYGSALLIVAAGAFIFAIGTILMRRVSGVPVFHMQAWLTLLAWPPLLAASLLLEGSPVRPVLDISWRSAAGLAWVALGTSLIGHSAYYWIIQRHEVSATAAFMLLSPILSVLGGVLLMGDVVTWRIVVGGALTLAGVLIISLRESRLGRRPKLSETTP